MKATQYYMMGVSEISIGKLENSTYSAFNRHAGGWFESSYAFDHIVMGYAEPIPKAEVESRIQALFPAEDVKQWF